MEKRKNVLFRSIYSLLDQKTDWLLLVGLSPLKDENQSMESLGEPKRMTQMKPNWTNDEEFYRKNSINSLPFVLFAQYFLLIIS